MLIWNDGPGRIVLVTHEDAHGVEPFSPLTRIGAALADLLGGPASTWFATTAVLPVPERRSMPRHAYGYEAREALAERRVIVVGREAAQLLGVPEEPLMIWMPNRWRWLESDVERVYLPPIFSAAFPAPNTRSAWWRDPENVDVAKQWLEEQGAGR